jgi:hypothetical protein
MLGGINNIDIINASQRGARDKLNQMAGIKRPPSGILASSPELMQAVAGAPPAMPIRPTGPATPIPMVQPALPQVPMQTAVASAPRPMAPAPAVPTVPQPASPTTPMKFQEAGPVDIRKTPTVSDPASAFVDTVNSLGAGVYEALLKRYGSPEKTEQAVKGQVAAVKAAVETGNPENIANTVIDQAGLPLNDESKQDFARTVFGLDDVNDIDEINRRIADVAIGASVGKGPDKFAQAVLLGLQNYKQTASARAAAKSGGGSGMSPLEPFPDAVRDLAGKIMTATGEDPQVAIQQARDALAPYYTGQVTAEPSQEAPKDSGLPTVTNKEQYDALPSGSEFMQNGQRRRKP